MLNVEFVRNLNEETLQRLDCAESETEFRQILAESGATAEEVESLMDYLKNAPEELSEAELEDVAGGGPTLQRYLCKWAYRVKHGKWFVKTSYDPDSRTITATNRFGKSVSETYFY